MRKKTRREWTREIAADTVYDVLGSILYGAGIYTFALAANFAPGGVAGLSIIINFFTQLPVGICTLVLNIPIILVSYKILGKVFLLKSLKTMVISAIFMDAVFPLIPVYTGDPLLAAIFAGALSGAGLALIYMRGSSTGGTDFLILSIRKKLPHLSIGTITLFTDGVVILLGGIVFGRVDAALQGAIATIASTFVIDKIVYGAGSGKVAMIITNRGMDIARAISEETGRGSTMMKATGTYSGAERQMLMCACGKAEITKVRAICHKIDPGALVMITSYDEAFGEGFQPPNLE